MDECGRTDPERGFKLCVIQGGREAARCLSESKLRRDEIHGRDDMTEWEGTQTYSVAEGLTLDGRMSLLFPGGGGKGGRVRQKLAFL